jgi:hypothetical protein
MFRKYQHVERFGNQEVEGIEIGITHVFPKIDGTNGSIWNDNGQIMAGSRNRELTPGKDNQGFLAWVYEQENIIDYLFANPTHRLYGEWLVPHSLKTYREDAWRRFYVFDITVDCGEEIEYIPYDDYKDDLDDCKIDYIPIICTMKNGSYEQFIKSLEKNVFLIQDGEGTGEGIVIKNYDFKNK